jgi:hypothetical protein
MKIIDILMQGFIAPSTKQMELHARFSHTLAAASLIGAVTFPFTDAWKSDFAGLKMAILLAFGVSLYFLGLILGATKQEV